MNGCSFLPVGLRCLRAAQRDISCLEILTPLLKVREQEGWLPFKLIDLLGTTMGDSRNYWKLSEQSSSSESNRNNGHCQNVLCGSGASLLQGKRLVFFVFCFSSFGGGNKGTNREVFVPKNRIRGRIKGRNIRALGSCFTFLDFGY